MVGVAPEIAFHSLLAHRWLSGRTDCRHFSEIFGRGEVYQLAPAGTESEEEFSPQHLRGRFLLDQGINYTYLDDRFSSGATIKATKLTKEFDYVAFQALSILERLIGIGDVEFSSAGTATVEVVFKGIHDPMGVMQKIQKSLPPT